MRKIKFRGMSISSKKWELGDLIRNKENEYFIHFYDCNGFECLYEVYPKSVGQYTGLKDKNGKEIYEGNIARAYGGESHSGYYEYDDKCIVKWQSNGFDLIRIKDNCEMGWGCYNCYEFIEIIGNSYENPELLESEV